MADQKVCKKGPGMNHRHSPKTILFITTGHLTTNPRLIKEAEAATSAGWNVIISGSFYVKSQIAYDQEVFRANPSWIVDFVDWSGNSFSSRLLKTASGIRQKSARFLVSFLPSDYLKFLSFFRIGPEVLSRCLKYKNADLAIAHNLGALPVAGKWSRKTGKPYCFDAEDYHSGETKNPGENPEKSRIETVENDWIPGTSTLTAASPLIAERYMERFPGKHFQTINNVFPIRFLAPEPIQWTPANPLTICWFSQTVGPDRGLEYLLPACGDCKDLNIRLLIIGNLPKTEENWWNSLTVSSGFPSDKIQMAGTLSPDRLFKLCSTAQLGIALEDPEIENRNICLTNKLFTYLLCGMGIIASSTKAQVNFFKTCPGCGELVSFQSSSEIAGSIKTYYNDPDYLHKTRLASWNIAKDKLNWEKESQLWISSLPFSEFRQIGGQ